MVAALAGQQSTSLSLYKEAPYLSGAVAIPLKDAASAGKVAASLATLDNAAASALLRAQLGDTSSVEWTVKKESVGKLKTQHFQVKLKKKPEARQRLSKRLLGQTLDVYWTVADTRMLLTLGKDAKTRLTAIAAGKAPPEPNKAVADAQAAAVARDLFYYVDLTPVLSVVGVADRGAAAGGAGQGRRQPDPGRLHGGRRRRRQAVDRRPDGPGGGVRGHRDAGRGGHGRELARGSRARGSRSPRRLALSHRFAARIAAARIARASRQLTPLIARARGTPRVPT